MNKEEKNAIKFIKKDLEEEKKLRDDYKWKSGFYENGYIEILLNLLEKQQKTIEINKKITGLAETQILTYAQGYRDGLHREVTATEIVAREREEQLLCHYIEKNINTQWKEEIKEKIELLKDIKKANCYKQLTEDYLKGAIEQLEELLGE